MPWLLYKKCMILGFIGGYCWPAIFGSQKSKWKCWFKKAISTHEYRFSIFTLSFHFEDFRFVVIQNIYF